MSENASTFFDFLKKIEIVVRQRFFRSECPVAAAENGYDLAVLADAVDVHAVAADHEVLVDHGIIDAQRPGTRPASYSGNP